MSGPYTLINLNVPDPLLAELNDLSKALGRARSHVILHAIRKSMAGLREEASKAVHHRLLREKEHGSWTD